MIDTFGSNLTAVLLGLTVSVRFRVRRIHVRQNLKVKHRTTSRVRLGSV